MNNNTSISLASVRKAEFKLLFFSIQFILSGMFNRRIKSTAHYAEWYHLPMNYARIMEMPLALQYLEPKQDERILDVSSPKLLSLYLASSGFKNVIAADLEEYFVKDFEIYKNEKKLPIEMAVFDASLKIPYSESHFDKVFSVSVLEHIPNGGDHLAIKEIMKALKPSGTLVVTLPAFKHYVEEWATDENYWKSVDDGKGKTFFQRRYDKKALFELFSGDGYTIEELILVAEKPIKPPEIGSNGIMIHNSYLINQISLSRIINKISRRFARLPLLQYIAERVASTKCHYLTTDWNDPNIRQVVVKIRKNATTGIKEISAN
jgi:SAM-dependent methyltransferase